MRLTSNYPGRIFWRTFNPDDTVYIIGHQEGVLRSGQFENINHPSGRFQLELKRDDIGGTFLNRPGAIFNNSDNAELRIQVVNGVPLGDLVIL